MALPIASMPVLTGEVAQRFEAEAQANNQRYISTALRKRKRQTRRLLKGGSSNCVVCWLKRILVTNEFPRR